MDEEPISDRDLSLALFSELRTVKYLLMALLTVVVLVAIAWLFTGAQDKAERRADEIVECTESERC